MDYSLRTKLERLRFRVVRYRELRGLRQVDLADQAGIALSTLNDLERGQGVDVRLSTLLALGEVLEATPDRLLGFEENGSSNGQGREKTAEAIFDLHDSGWTTARISIEFGLHESSVRQILEAECESRRLRRHAAGI